MALPETMKGVVLTGHGGLEKLEWREDIPVPAPAPDEVLIRVAAAAVNNTDVNTRTGWYSKSVRGDTASGATAGYGGGADEDGSWSGAALAFPRIQGADCCGEIVAVGSLVADGRIGERVLVRALQSPASGDGDLPTAPPSGRSGMAPSPNTRPRRRRMWSPCARIWRTSNWPRSPAPSRRPRA